MRFPLLVCEAPTESWWWGIHQLRLIMRVYILMLPWIKEKNKYLSEGTEDERDGHRIEVIHEDSAFWLLVWRQKIVTQVRVGWSKKDGSWRRGIKRGVTISKLCSKKKNPLETEEAMENRRMAKGRPGMHSHAAFLCWRQILIDSAVSFCSTCIAS